VDRWGRFGISLLCLWAVPGLGAFLPDQDTQVTDQTQNQLSPAVAHSLTQSEFLVIYQWDRTAASGPLELWGQRVSDAGLPSGDPFFIVDPGNSVSPAVAHDSGSDTYLVVWQDHWDWGTNGSDICAQRIVGIAGTGDDDGQLIGDPIPVAVREDHQSDPSVCSDTEHGEFLVVWSDSRNTSGVHIYGQRIRATDGSTLGGNIQITSGLGNDDKRPVAAYAPADNSYLVVWSQAYDGMDPSHLAQRVTITGALRGDVFDVTAQNGYDAGRAAVSRMAGNLLVAFSAQGTAWGRLVREEHNPSGSQLVGDEHSLGEADVDSMFNVDHIPALGKWLVVWDNGPDPYALRGCWVETDATPIGGDFPIAEDPPVGGGNSIVATHGTSGGDEPRVFHAAQATDGTLTAKIFTRALPQSIGGDSLCEAEQREFLRLPVFGFSWNMVAVRPAEGFNVDLSIFPEVRFFTGTPLAESAVGGMGRLELIAVAGQNTGAITLNMMLELAQSSPTTCWIDHSIAFGLLDGYSETTGSLDSEGNFLHAFNLGVTSGTECVISLIPTSGDPVLGLAVIDAGTVPVAQCRGLGDAIAYSDRTTPGFVESVTLDVSESDIEGLAVWCREGSGDYRLVVRDPDEPTTDEIVAYLLGLMADCPGGNVNGDGLTDSADVVANIAAGR
jgi:hypothetical protein